MKKFKWIHPIIASVVTIGVGVGLIIGNVLCAQNANLITRYLVGNGYYENSEEAVTSREQGNALAEDVEEQGAVLLKNENNVLPLTSEEGENPKVNVFGWASSDNGFLPQGTGSGTGSRNDLVTFLGGLTESGIDYNTELAAIYDSLSYNRVSGGSYVIEATTESLYKSYYGVTEAIDSGIHDGVGDINLDSMISSSLSYSDTAIIVLGRLLGEGNDYSKTQYISNQDNNESRKLQAISEEEENLINKVSAVFDKVIVVLNTTNPMELSFADDERIDSVIYMGTPGTRGAIGLANLLKGEATPSGHLTDTWAYDLSTAASYATSGREGVGSYLDISTDTTLSTRANKYSEYLEDIYVGYFRYETADAEGFWDSDYAKEMRGIENGYEDVVQYPFGYGLSYTTFDWDVDQITITHSDGSTTSTTGYTQNLSNLASDDEVTVTVYVTNTGDTYSGADVVQLYYSAPYYDGGIEKSSIKLLAFEKTSVLEPGNAEKLELSFSVEDMKSYDTYDKNNNGFMGYELEGGSYSLSLRTDVHTVKETTNGINTFNFNIPFADSGTTGYLYETDSTTGTKVENQFTTYTNETSGASSTINEPLATKAHSIDGSENDGDKITYVTREDFESTFPKEKPENKNAGSLIDDMHYVRVDNVIYEDDEEPTFGSTDTSWILTDVYGLDYDNELWDDLVSQLDQETLMTLITRGGFGTIAIDSIGKPQTSDADGPTGFNNNVTGTNNVKAVCYPSSTILASTWDWYMAYQVGSAIGVEGAALGIQGWYGPGANLHRSPMGGRNFEYYSEDPLLAGIMCAYEVNGAKEQGLTSYIKHFGPNELDSGRNGAYKWLTEQSLRELYNKPFELAVKIGGANAMMSSVDRVGGARVSGSYALLTTVLREERGFDGTVITDYYQHAGKSSSTHTIHDVDECVRAGNSQMLYPDGSSSWFDDTESNTAKQAIFKSGKDILYAYADTMNYAETAQGLEKGSLVTSPSEVFAWWIPVLVVLDIVVGLGLLSWVGIATYKFIKAYKEDKKVATTETN